MTSDSSGKDKSDLSSKVFLLSKRTQPTNPPEQVALGAKTLDMARQACPALLVDSAFRAQIDEMTATAEKFVAMAIQFDDTVGQDPNRAGMPSPQATASLIRALEKHCRSLPGLWGIVNTSVYGCVICHSDAAACRLIAMELQRQVSKDATVTIGLAEYPTLDYTKGQILENAVKALEHAKFLSPQALVVFDAVSLNISGDRLYDDGCIQDAVDEFHRALRLDKSNANVHNSLGVCYALMDDIPKALAAFKTSIGLDETEPLAHYNAGLAHKILGDRQSALKYLLTAHRLNSEMFEAALQIGCLYNEMDQSGQAEAVLKKAVALSPDSAAAHSQLGECYVALNRRDEAISAYKTAIKKYPNDAVSLSGLGWLYFLGGENLDIAKLFCEQSVELAPTNGRFHFRLGRICLAEKRFQEALDRFEASMKLGYDSTDDIEQTKALLDEETEIHETYHPQTPGRQHCG